LMGRLRPAVGGTDEVATGKRSLSLAFPVSVLATRPACGKPTVAFIRLLPRSSTDKGDTLAEVIAT
jgi:hypothetical protein